MKNDIIGIVILNYITWNDTMRCISSIRKFNEDLIYKIYVVDNASPVSANEEIISQLTSAKDITYLPAKLNKGYAAGNNIGIAEALRDGCEYILVTNSDIVFQANSISQMVEAFELNREVGIVGPLVINKGGKIQKSTKFCEGGLKQKYLAETLLRKFYPKYRQECFGTEADYYKDSFVYAVSGCCFMISKECALKVTPLDENTFLYGEEAILGKRMENNKFKTLYYPESSVLHDHGSSTSHVKAFSFICKVNSEMYYCRNYLNAKFLSILPLYLIRTISFLVHAIVSSDYRKNLTRYFKETLKYL